MIKISDLEYSAFRASSNSCADSISIFLEGVWRDGALMGAKKEEAFFVTCDRSTMDDDDILNGRLVAAIGARFGIVVSEKAAVQAIPIIGAAGGAVVNTVFIGHYQDMARGHFTVRRLERIYSPEMVRAEYDRLP